VQQKAIYLTRVMREEAISSLYRSMQQPKRLAIADLGCSCGPNTLFVMSEAIKLVEKLCRELKHESPEYEIYLNDLPGNDFNSIFKSLERFKERLRNEIEDEHGMGSCFFNGVPGSFYGRIFPRKTLHFVHSSYSLMWLSKVSCNFNNKIRFN